MSYLLSTEKQVIELLKDELFSRLNISNDKQRLQTRSRNSIILVQNNDIGKIIGLCVEATKGTEADTLYQIDPYFYGKMDEENMTNDRWQKQFENFMGYFEDADEAAILRSIKKVHNYSTNDNMWDEYVGYPKDKTYLVLVENFNFWDLKSQYIMSKHINGGNIMIVGQVRSDFEFAKDHVPYSQIYNGVYLTLDNENNISDVNLNEKQLNSLNAIYLAGSLAPVFKVNRKYNKGLTPYIAYSDIMNNNYIIRGREPGINNSLYDEKKEIIREYNSIEEIIEDGWILD